MNETSDRRNEMPYCEDAPCCGCCFPPNAQDQREAEEACWEEQQDEWDYYVDFDDDDEWNDNDGLSDVEADAMTLASAGMGTDEDYGYYNECDMLDMMMEDQMSGGEF